MWGQVCRICDSKGSIKDHPHACGDKSVPVFDTVPVLGSSPRVWGQDRKYTIRTKLLRIIPTRVGTSLVENISDTIDEDHPHACGDKGLMRLCARYAPGSSPRVWGQEVCVAGLCKGTGIIPTRVGTRLMKYIPDGSVEDHPHACGDKAS